MSDLVRCMQPVPPNMRLEFIRASSYGSGTTTSGQVSITMSTLSDEDIKGRHILLVRMDNFFPPIAFFMCAKVFCRHGNTMPVVYSTSMSIPSASVAYIDRYKSILLYPADNRAFTHGYELASHSTCSLFAGLHTHNLSFFVTHVCGDTFRVLRCLVSIISFNIGTHAYVG